MPKEYPAEFKARAVRLVRDRLASDEMLSHRAAMSEVGKQAWDLERDCEALVQRSTGEWYLSLSRFFCRVHPLKYAVITRQTLCDHTADSSKRGNNHVSARS